MNLHRHPFRFITAPVKRIWKGKGNSGPDAAEARSDTANVRSDKAIVRSDVKNVILFVVITLGFHFIWKLFQDQIESAAIVIWLGDWMATRAYLAADWIQTQLLSMNYTTAEPNIFRFPNGGSIIINESCSGLKQFYQVIVLFALFPGPWKHKSWFIPSGILIMHLTNIFRVVMLSVVMAYLPQHWDFMHDWVLRPFFYVVLFALWIWWVERVARG